MLQSVVHHFRKMCSQVSVNLGLIHSVNLGKHLPIFLRAVLVQCFSTVNIPSEWKIGNQMRIFGVGSDPLPADDYSLT